MSKKISKLKNFLLPQKILAGISFLVGLVLGYISGLFRIHSFFFVPKISIDFSWLNSLSSWVTGIIPNTTFLSDIAAVEGVLIGVSIPISLQVVSWAVDRYKDQELASFFTNEKLYKAQFFLFLPNIVLAIVLRFLDIKNFVILGIILVWFVINVIVFYFFLQLIRRYAVETDKIFIEKLKKHAEKII